MSEQETKNPLDQLEDENTEETQDDQTDTDGGNDGEPTAPQAPSEPVAPTAPQTVPTAPAMEPEQPVAPQAPERTAEPQINHVAPGAKVGASGMPVAARQSDSGIKYYLSQRHKAVKERLEKQPKVLFIIPKVDGEAAGLAYDTVQIDGFRMEIKKGVAVTIPEQVAHILAEKYRIGSEAGSEHLISRDEKISEVLG